MQLRRLKPNQAQLRVATLTILIVMCTLLILSAVFPFPEGTWDFLSIGISPSVSANSDWLSGYSQRMALNVTGSSASTATNYSLELTVFAGAGASTNATSYLSNGCSNWPYDIRFTEDDGTTKLYYKRITYNSTQGTWWVRFNSLPQSDNATFYIYYGKADDEDDATYHDAEQVFSFFDEFSSGQGSEFAKTSLLYYGATKATYYNGYTYFTYLEWDAADPEIRITAYNHTTDEWASPVTVSDAPYLNGHCSPHLAVDSSGYLYVSWADYGAGNKVYISKSTSAEDISAWGTPVEIADDANDPAYPNIIAFSASNIICLYRDNYSYWKLKKSTDGGDTWGAATTIVTATGGIRPYVMAYKGASDRLHIGWARSDFTNIYYAYSADEGSTWKDIDGDALTLPIDYDEADALAVTHSPAMIWDIKADGSNNPCILFCEFGDDKHPSIALWDGAAWNDIEVSASSTVSNGGNIIMTDTDNIAVYVPTDVSSVAEIYQYVTSDGGDNWTPTAITSSSPDHNSNIVVPLNYNNEVKLIALRGTTGYEGARLACYYNADTTTYAPFDVAEQTGLDTNKWSVVSGAPWLEDNQLHLDASDKIIGLTGFGYGYAFEANAIANEQDTGFLTIQSSDPYVKLELHSTDGSGYDGTFTTITAYTRDDEANADSDDQEGWYNFSTAYHTYRILRWPDADDKLTFEQDDNTYDDDLDREPTTTLYPGFRTWSPQESQLDVNWILVRKLIYPEPYMSGWGEEETQSIEISNNPSSNAFGTLEVNTTSNTAINYFTITNTGNTAVDVTVYGTDATGGVDDTWDLDDSGTPGENVYALYAGLDDEDDTFDTIVKESGSTPYNTLVSDLAESGTQDWGLKIYMPTSLSGYDNQQMSATITLVASEAT